MFPSERDGPIGFAERLPIGPGSAGREAVRRGCAALAAGAQQEATQWFARARRLSPDDAAAHHLLAASLAASAPERALALLGELLERVPQHRDARVSRIAILHRVRRHAEAADELDTLLAGFAIPAAPGFAGLADAVCASHPACSGWVGVSGDGRVLARGVAGLRLGRGRLAPQPDGLGYRLPADWRRRGGTLVAGGRVLGARIDLGRIARVEGGLTGCAQAPADPDTRPAIAVFDAATRVPGAAPPAASWMAGRRGSAVVLVTHAAGGGVERCVAARAAQLEAEGARPIVVRPGVAGAPPRTAPAGDGDWPRPERPAPPSGFALHDGTGAAPPLRVATVEALADLLREDRPASVELHHIAAHDPTVIRLPGLLRVPFDVVVHDYAAICPRVTMCGGAARYCGEPDDPRDCEDCLADHGARIPFDGSVAGHRAAQAMLLCAARRVLVPSHDAAERLRGYMPRLAPVVTPWEDDSALAPGVRLPVLAPDATVSVAVVGAIGIDKGFSVLLACARDAARRELPLRFVVVGHTIDDERLFATGRCFVTGRFAEGKAPEILAEFDAKLGFLPSVWPETWCFALSALWQARLHVLAFDLGAPAERIVATGAGTLLPLGTEPAAINDRCLALARPLALAHPAPPRLIRAGRRAHG